MEDNIALVYMTLNMIYYYIYLIYMYHILLIISFNQTEFRTASFSHFSSSCENQNCFRCFAAPNPTPKTPGPRASPLPPKPNVYRVCQLGSIQVQI